MNRSATFNAARSGIEVTPTKSFDSRRSSGSLSAALQSGSHRAPRIARCSGCSERGLPLAAHAAPQSPLATRAQLWTSTSLHLEKTAGRPSLTPRFMHSTSFARPLSARKARMAPPVPSRFTKPSIASKRAGKGAPGASSAARASPRVEGKAKRSR